jgi:hypothetical protein
MTDEQTGNTKQFLKKVWLGSGIFGIVIGLLILFVALFLQAQEPTIEEQATKVVGTYKGCDIVRWHYGALAEYKYFLYCNE